MDYEALVGAWDADRAVRDRLRVHNRLLLSFKGRRVPLEAPDETESVVKSADNARANDIIIRHVFGCMNSSGSLKLPNIDNLQGAMQRITEINLGDGKADTRVCYKDAWSLRSLCQLVKARLYKKKPPQDICVWAI